MAHSFRVHFSAILSAVVLGAAGPTGIDAQDLQSSTAQFVSELPKPGGIADFRSVPHFPPQHQDTTLVCWSFATTSFIESEMLRLGLDSVRLAIMFPVYNVFLEKAKLFVSTHGSSRFAPGDLFTGVWDVAQEYGLVPLESYSGQARVCPTYNQDPLYRELDSLMAHVKSQSDWDEASVLSRVRTILNKYLGPPPSTFDYRGKNYTPLSFLHEVVRIPWGRYVKVISFEYAPFGTFTLLRVPDNWRRDSSYFNVPLNMFYQSMQTALARGYSFAVDADISEPEYRYGEGAIAVPPSDIGREDIDQNAREYRFAAGSTTDDHLMHAVGYATAGKRDWFLLKDSWRTAWRGSHAGYMFADDSYMRLKVLAFLIDRDAVPALDSLVSEAERGKNRDR